MRGLNRSGISEASLVRWLDGVYDSPWGKEWAQDVGRAHRNWTKSFPAAPARLDRPRCAGCSFSDVLITPPRDCNLVPATAFNVRRIFS